jgi:uncharacterized membrane protein (Fun14 family)
MEPFTGVATTIGIGFFGGILVGWALKKVIKVIAFIVGLFSAGIAYLQYRQSALINWNELEQTALGGVSNLVDAIGINNGSGQPTIADLAITNFGIPLTSSLSIGLSIGFMKG